MQQYFVEGAAQELLTISDQDMIKHMFQVMRLTDGDTVTLVFDDGIKRLARVVDSSAHLLEILEDLSSDVELPVEVTVALGFPKGDKLDFLAQKTTELGVQHIWAFPAAWSVAKWNSQKLTKKALKLTKIVRGAAQQSQRNRIPQIQLFAKKEDFLGQLSKLPFDKIFIAYEEAAKAGESSVLARELAGLTGGQKILFIFGPEGGLSPEEITLFQQAGGRLVGLGPRIMRAETAPLYALSAISYVMELEK